MRVLLLADYRAGLDVAKFLMESDEEIVGLVVHPPRMENHINHGYTGRIVELLGLPKDRVFDGDDLQTGVCLEQIKGLAPDIALSVFWGLILKPEMIEIPPRGCINFHCSYLPYNRGKNPNVWPIVEGTLAGVTLHYINPGVDTGDIVAQRQVAVEPVDTGESLYDKLTLEIVDLFKVTWPAIKNGSLSRRRQDDGSATFHYGKDLRKLDVIDLDQKYTGRELIDLLRARTFPPYPSAYYVADDGRKVYVRVQLAYAGGHDEVNQGSWEKS